MEKQEYVMRLNMLEQEANVIEERLHAIDQHMKDLSAIESSLREIGKGKELLANLGKGIFVKTKVEEDTLLVNVGNGVILKKTSEETKEIIQEQIKMLSVGKEDFMQRAMALQEEMNLVMEEAREEQN